MDYETQEGLKAVEKAIRNRKSAGLKKKAAIGELRDLDEAICLTSRALYIRFLSTAMWGRSVDEATLKTVKKVLEDAVNCLPAHEYPPHQKSPYPVRKSVSKRLGELNKLSGRMVRDQSRPGWFVIPLVPSERVLEPA
jgi:hypothetical protein